MGNIVLMVMATAIAIVVGGYGLGKVCYERGYVHGYEDAENPIEVTLDED